MKTRRFLKLTGSGIIVFLLAGGCSLDDSPVGPAVLSETTSTYTIDVSVIPSSAFRTTGTWNAWVNPVQTEFAMVLEDAAHDDDHADTGMDDDAAGEDLHDTGDGHAEDERHHGDFQIGDVTLDGIRIVMTADNAGADMYHVHHDAIEHVEAPHDARLFSVHLYDALHERACHGATNIGYSDVVLNAVNEAESHVIALRPVHTPDGFRYEANAALPRGTWDLHVEAGPPEFVRLAGYETKWLNYLEVEFHDFSMAGSMTSKIDGELGIVLALFAEIRVR